MSRFIACFEQHRADSLVWSVKMGRVWIHAKEIRFGVPVQTVYRGPQAIQPRAYLQGEGVIHATRQRIDILPW